MQAEARAEADAMVAAAEAEVEAEQQSTKKQLAELAAQREALEAEYAGNQERLEAELAGMRADAQEEREQLLADAKQEADHYREQARRAVDEATRQRIEVLEQLMGVYRDLDGGAGRARVGLPGTQESVGDKPVGQRQRGRTVDRYPQRRVLADL